MVLQRSRDGYVEMLTLARPEKRNALNLDLVTALADALTDIDTAAPADVRAVLIHGEGAAFCAGADLAGVYSAEFLSGLQRMLTAVLQCRVPVIVDIQGPAVGAGVQLALAADLRVVGDDAWFMVPPAKYGFALDNWTIRRCESMLGGSIARGMLLGALQVSAEQAGACGFANLRGDSKDALEFAHEVAGFAPLAVEQLKQVLNEEGFGFGLSAASQQLFEAAWSSEDVAEAQRARAENRAPNFTGR